MEEGLVLEKETIGCLTFVKIHAPRHVLRKNCEALKIKMPMKWVSIFSNMFIFHAFVFLNHHVLKIEEDKPATASQFNIVSEVKTLCKRTIRAFISIDPKKSYQDKDVLYAEYSRDKFYL